MNKHNKVTFGHVNFYFFGRCIGNDKVPEYGSNPLGMESSHFFTKTVTIYKKDEPIVLDNGDCSSDLELQCEHNNGHSSPGHERISDDLQSVHSVFSIDYTSNSLQPLNPRQRIKCLKECGIEIVKDKLWSVEGKDLIRLRKDRQKVGCKCKGLTRCDSELCECSSEGVSCLSDGSGFPCKCGLKCSNPSGMRHYSKLRIKYHYKHTLQQKVTDGIDNDSSSLVTQYGDCQLCSDIDDKKLRQLFKNPVAQKRKRVATVDHKSDLIQSDFVPKRAHDKSDSVLHENICPVVMTVTSTLFPPLRFGELSKKVYSPQVGLGDDNCSDTDKENINTDLKLNAADRNVTVITESPAKVREVLVPINVPKLPVKLSRRVTPYWPNEEDLNVSNSPLIDSDEEDLESALKIVEESIRSLDVSSDAPVFLREFMEPDKLSSSDKCIPTPIVDIDSLVEVFQPKDLFKFRVCTTYRPPYFESPFMKCKRRRKSARLRGTTLGRTITMDWDADTSVSLSTKMAVISLNVEEDVDVLRSVQQSINEDNAGTSVDKDKKKEDIRDKDKKKEDIGDKDKKKEDIGDKDKKKEDIGDKDKKRGALEDLRVDTDEDKGEEDSSYNSDNA